MRRRWIYPLDGSDPVEVGPDGYEVTPRLQVIGDIEGYVSPVTGLWVEGRKARREDLKRSGCRPYEPGEKEANERRQAADQAAFERRNVVISRQSVGIRLNRIATLEFSRISISLPRPT